MNSAVMTICLRMIGILNILTEEEPYAHATPRIESVEIKQHPYPLVYKVERYGITAIKPAHGKTINRQNLARYLQRLQSFIASAQFDTKDCLELAHILHDLGLDPAVLAGQNACEVSIMARDEVTGRTTRALWHIIPGN